jgi:hypothetical protein
VQAGWTCCPFCRRSLAAEELSEVTLPADAGAGRDLSSIGGLLILAGVLIAAGIMFFFCGGGTVRQMGLESIALVGVFCLAAIGAGVGLSATGKSPGGNLASGLLGGLAMAFVVCGLALAFIIGVLNDCTRGCK